ncbi:hypothetical protein [Enterobacter sp. 22466]|uniref:hypothetical protein n=1 Tax=Enterobacter sp. 22466 TaxID=3453924 RepID=UPI003F852887
MKQVKNTSDSPKNAFSLLAKKYRVSDCLNKITIDATTKRAQSEAGKIKDCYTGVCGSTEQKMLFRGQFK